MCVGPLAPSPPKMPPPPPPPEPPPPPPKRADPAVQASRADEQQRVRAMAGRASTIATGPQGLGDDTLNATKKTLGA